MFLTDALSLSHVPRWVVVRTLRAQSTADHSFRVAMILQEILTRHPRLTRAENVLNEESTVPAMIRPFNAIWHALTHDIDECVTGDIPGIAKQHMRAKREIPDLVPDKPDIGVTLPEIQLVKLADLMETYTFLELEAVGPHAQSVVQWLREDVLSKVISEAQSAGLVDSLKIEAITRAIISEKGRLRTYGPYKP